MENRTIPSPPARMEAGVKSAAKQLGFPARDVPRLDTTRGHIHHSDFTLDDIQIHQEYRSTDARDDIGATA